jgi:hypothetical protein
MRLVDRRALSDPLNSEEPLNARGVPASKKSEKRVIRNTA